MSLRMLTTSRIMVARSKWYCVNGGRRARSRSTKQGMSSTSVFKRMCSVSCTIMDFLLAPFLRTKIKCTGPNWSGGLKSPPGQRASAYVEGCLLLQPSYSFPRSSAPPTRSAQTKQVMGIAVEEVGVSMLFPELGLLVVQQLAVN